MEVHVRRGMKWNKREICKNANPFFTNRDDSSVRIFTPPIYQCYDFWFYMPGYKQSAYTNRCRKIVMGT